jgi:predicted TIM-barrel fold metal-dependent hydrolase
LLGKFPNVYCDTAFVDEDALRQIVNKGFASRVLLGSDFPVTHYYYSKNRNEGENIKHLPSSWKSQYAEDVKLLKRYEAIISEATK